MQERLARIPRFCFSTHTLCYGRPSTTTRLGRHAAKAINLASRENRLAISAITPWEIGLLASKKRINLYKDVKEWVRDALAKPGVALVPLEPEIAVASTRLPFEMHA